MKTDDNQEPFKKNPKGGDKPLPAGTVLSTSRSGRTTTVAAPGHSAAPGPAGDAGTSHEQEKKIKGVTMVAWTLDDALAITAVSDWTLKIWDSHKGNF